MPTNNTIFQPNSRLRMVVSALPHRWKSDATAFRISFALGCALISIWLCFSKMGRTPLIYLGVRFIVCISNGWMNRMLYGKLSRSKAVHSHSFCLAVCSLPANTMGRTDVRIPKYFQKAKSFWSRISCRRNNTTEAEAN